MQLYRYYLFVIMGCYNMIPLSPFIDNSLHLVPSSRTADFGNCGWHPDTSPLLHRLNQVAALSWCQDVARRRRRLFDGVAPPPGSAAARILAASLLVGLGFNAGNQDGGPLVEILIVGDVEFGWRNSPATRTPTDVP
jgi:hypothetical protein